MSRFSVFTGSHDNAPLVDVNPLSRLNDSRGSRAGELENPREESFPEVSDVPPRRRGRFRPVEIAEELFGTVSLNLREVNKES